MVAAMQIIRRAKFKTVPWKNGGGITHEVAKAEEDGRLLWRLSLAEVASDGPFSLFPGLARILTVIDGDGMDLRDATGHIVHLVPPLTPVHFSGDEPLTGTLRAGKCLDFNLIYDPFRFAGSVKVVSGADNKPGDLMGGLLCLSGSVICSGEVLRGHDFAFVERGELINLGPNASALHVQLRDHQVSSE
jgi:environmental stress-induced protein Ves